ncbi:MAG: twin-arginine translocase subunit TatC, partial [Deltaproteobacteria bacterium]|nr:twin-arginine translocase subunit TatC [Deltaproteobacteria bacterium]
MSGTDSSPLPEGPASSPSVSSGAQEHGGADAGHGASEAQDNRAFEDALSFRAWDGESDADAPDGGGAALPAPSEAQPPTGRDTGESAAQDGNGDAAGKPMSLMGHLSELRTRLVRVLIVIILGFFACYAVAEPLFDALVRPLVANMPPGSKL